MANKPFYYGIKEHALFDLKLFSTMNANENIVLYVKKTNDGCFWIDHNTVFSDEIEAIAINGKVFLPTAQ
jgi:hypothetical protein